MMGKTIELKHCRFYPSQATCISHLVALAEINKPTCFLMLMKLPKATPSVPDEHENLLFALHTWTKWIQNHFYLVLNHSKVLLPMIIAETGSVKPICRTMFGSDITIGSITTVKFMGGLNKRAMFQRSWGIPFTFYDSATLALCLDKPKTKCAFEASWSLAVIPVVCGAIFCKHRYWSRTWRKVSLSTLWKRFQSGILHKFTVRILGTRMDVLGFEKLYSFLFPIHPTLLYSSQDWTWMSTDMIFRYQWSPSRSKSVSIPTV